ncbi:VOC family protein [Gracilibacillus salinarum]|uniref:VOC family protein n=1 Tax=Gracilibacillus salinarum TaxID=2932255 RepID=A0ABY4GRB0_9BACI|nr:VOC family protein [Gracilibacillus salinarum]UOQ86907.1 VOC family protein [Gracilibacillus salinarum]
MKLRLELFVKNIEETVHFYQRVLGFTAPSGINEKYTPITNGNVVIGLAKLEKLEQSHPLKTEGNQPNGKGVEIVLEVKDLEGTYERVLSTDYKIETPLKERPWGLSDFRLIDPDGYYIRVSS